MHSLRGAERECFPVNCLPQLSNAFAISIANLSFAGVVRMSELCLMAVLHRTGLGKLDNFTGFRIFWKGQPCISSSLWRSQDQRVSASAIPFPFLGQNWIWHSY